MGTSGPPAKLGARPTVRALQRDKGGRGRLNCRTPDDEVRNAGQQFGTRFNPNHAGLMTEMTGFRSEDVETKASPRRGVVRTLDGGLMAEDGARQ
jgi:hypothetical protein